MSVWKPLLPVAMVGTDRAPLVVPHLPGDMGALLQQLAQATPDVATRLLQVAGVLATCSAAGARGGVPASPPTPAPDEANPALAEPALLALLGWVLREAPARLQHLALQRVADHGWRLPSALLPAALELGRRSVALRPPVQAAIGGRGQWLAAQNPEWRYAAGASDEAPLEERWAHGSPEQRRAVLVEERQRDPNAARERLAAELPQLAARERADLLGAMAHGLAPADEAWLDGLMNDRSREVRQVVAGLLLRLPGSGFVQRAVQRVAPLLSHERGLLRSSWRIEAPMQADPAWDAQGVDATRPKHESLGERAWWLYQLARQVPLAWWCERMSCTPKELFAWSLKTDWSEALLRAWRDVLLNTAEPDAIDALLEGWPWKGLAGDPAELTALLPLARREQHWQRRLAKERGALRELLPQLLAACAPGEDLSAPLSDTLAGAVRAAMADAQVVYDYTLRNTLPELCCVLHPGALTALASLPIKGDETPAHAELLHTLARVVDARRTFDQLPPASR